MKEIATLIALVFGIPNQKAKGIFKWDSINPDIDIIKARSILVKAGLNPSKINFILVGSTCTWNFETGSCFISAYYASNKSRFAIMSTDYKGCW